MGTIVGRRIAVIIAGFGVWVVVLRCRRLLRLRLHLICMPPPICGLAGVGGRAVFEICKLPHPC
jgi:hypothetical protein